MAKRIIAGPNDRFSTMEDLINADYKVIDHNGKILKDKIFSFDEAYNFCLTLSKNTNLHIIAYKNK